MKRRLVSILAIATLGFVLILVAVGTVAAEVGIEYNRSRLFRHRIARGDARRHRSVQRAALARLRLPPKRRGERRSGDASSL